MNADVSSSLYDELLLTDDSVGQNAWSKFLFNVDMAKSMGMLPQEQASLLLQAGTKWQ